MPGNILFQHRDSKTKRDVLFDSGTLRVVLTGCLAIAVSLMLMSFSSIMITRDAIVRNLKNVVIQYMAGSISASINAGIDRAVEASLILSSDPTVIKWVNSLEKDEDAGSVAKAKMLELTRNLGYDTAFLASTLSGNYWSCDSQEAKHLYTISASDPADAWFYKFLEMKRRYEININYDKQLKDTFVWIDVLAGDLEKPVAITGVGMNLSKVINGLIAEDSRNGLKNDIWLIDDKGDIYLSKNQEFIQKNLSVVLPEQLKNEILNSHVSANSLIPVEYKDKKGELYDVVYKKIKNTSWNLVIQIPRSESISFLNTIIYNTLLTCLFVIIVVITMFRILSNRIANPYKRALLINQELERKISERTKELNEKNEKIQDSIDYAKIIQKSILPPPEEMNEILEQHFVIWEPRDTVGGDFYWVRKFEDGILVVLGDCTGHGVPGALMTMAVNPVLNRTVDEICHNDPALILKEIDRLLNQSLRRDHSRETIQDDLDIGILFISNENKILFSGAQVSIWVGYEEGIAEIKGSRARVGSGYKGLTEEKNFMNTEIGYHQGMTLYMATDGLKDQPGGVRKVPYGKSRIKSLLHAIRHLTMEEQKREIVEAFEDYTKGEPRRDDIAMIGIRI